MRSFFPISLPMSCLLVGNPLERCEKIKQLESLLKSEIKILKSLIQVLEGEKKVRLNWGKMSLKHPAMLEHIHYMGTCQNKRNDGFS